MVETEIMKAALRESEKKRNHAEVALQKALHDLGRRTAALENAQKELENFTYSVSHDLRAPLRAINGFTEMILADKGPDFDTETLRKFHIVQENANKMGRLMDALLELSRFGRANMNRGRLDMNCIVRESLEEIRMTAPEWGITTEIGDIPYAEGDPTMARVLVDNLLSNAVKFTRETSEARIEVGSFEKNGRYVYFVKDNGIGFDMRYTDKLFGVFQRLVGETRFEGTGIGLALVKRIVQRHGGEVWAVGEPGKGAVFYFTLAPERDGRCPTSRDQP